MRRSSARARRSSGRSAPAEECARLEGITPYTKTNLREVENAAEKFGMEGMEARFARRLLACERSGLSLQRIAPNTRQAFGHRHRDQEEIYVVLGGSGRAKLDDDVVPLRRWDTVRISKDTMRCLEAGPEGLEFIAYGAGEQTPGEAEVVPAWWAD